MLTSVFFDLDGTLLPIDTHAFMQRYFTELERHFVLLGVDGRAAMSAVEVATRAMLSPDGMTTNARRFWDCFFTTMGDSHDWEGVFSAFYNGPFRDLGVHVSPDPDAVEAVRDLVSKGYQVAMLTNPLFPPEATAERIRWAGLDNVGFSRVTAYHNSLYAKPTQDYYAENLAVLGVSPDEVLMVGNDPVEDGAAMDRGIDFYLVTDHIITRQPGEGHKPRTGMTGSMRDFRSFVKTLPSRN